MVHYTHCPVCSSEKIARVLSAKDYTVTGERFAIWECSDCKLRFTQDVPAQNEIGRYYKAEDYISHTDSNKGLVNQLYQRVRKITLQTKLRQIEKITGMRKGSLLDVGAGTGTFVKTMQEAGWSVTGLEPDPDARKVALEQHGQQLQEIEELFHLPEASFDAITLWHVLEHVHELHRQMDRFYQLLKPGAVLLIAVPNYSSRDGEKYGEYWAAYDVPRHLYHFCPTAMEKLAELHAFSVLQMMPMWFDSYYIAMLSSKYKTGKTGYLSSFAYGTASNLAAVSDRKLASSVIYVLKKKTSS